MRMFPIMTDHKDVIAVRRTHGLAIVVQVPWPMLAAHEKQAFQNHDQSIATLASRGGLSACEAVAILEDRPWRADDLAVCHNRLKDLFNEWWAQHPQSAVG